MSTVSSSTSTVNPYLVAYSSSDISGTDSTASKYSTSSSSKSSSSSSSSSYSQSLIGQMTGLDVTNMVNESMQSDVVKLNSLLAKEQVSQWEQDRYRSVITNLQNFSSKYFDILSDDYVLSSNSFSVNSATSSNPYAVATNASNTAKIGAYTVTSATLATAANVTSSELKNTAGAKPQASDAISSMGVKDGTISFSVGGKSISYDLKSTSSISSVMQDLSSLSGLNFNYSELTGKFSISTQLTGANQNVDIEDISDGANLFSKFGLTVNGGSIIAASSATIAGSAVIQKSGVNAASSDIISDTSLNSSLTNGNTLTFNIDNGSGSKQYNYTVDTSKSIGTFMSDLSSLTGSNFSYDTSTGKISIDSIGSTTLSVSYADSSSAQTFFNNVFGGSGTSISENSSVTGSGTAGKDGSFIIQEPGDTSTTTVTESSNNFTIDGVSYNFSSNVTADSPVTINVNQDITSAVSKIQDFVTDYNNLIDGINTVVTEKKDYDYKPLSSSQESQMTDSQITSWNQKAQKGLLSNDGTLNDILNTMREAFYMPVNGNGFTMASVGLSTSDDPTQGGKITLDVKQLTTALQNNPQQVIDLFTKASTSYSTYEDALNVDTSADSSAISKAVGQRNSEEGIFQRLSDIEKKYAGTYVDKQGNQGILLMKAGMPGALSETKSTFYKELKDEASAVSDFKTKMESDEAMYNKKFTALQTMLSQLSSQQSALSSMLGTSSSN